MKYLLIILSFLFISCEWGFLNGIWDDENNESVTPLPLVDDYFSYNISNQVAYYFFDTVLVNNSLLDTSDWVGAFRNDICVGSQRWICPGTCEVPIYGEYSLNEGTDGYMLPGEIPSFKIYDSSEQIYYDAIPSSEIPWQDGITPTINSLIAQ